MGKRPVLYTVPEVADILRVSERHVWRLIADGALNATRFKGSTRISAEALDALLGR